jgi:hypothetical protein
MDEMDSMDGSSRPQEYDGGTATRRNSSIESISSIPSIGATRPGFAEIEARIDRILEPGAGPTAAAAELLQLSEAVLEHWVVARGEVPTQDRKEGFRLLALHRQGARGEPSFNACRETCRELAWHFGLITSEPADQETAQRLRLMAMLARHLFLFVSGKMQVAGLGEFCCSARPLHGADG